MVRLAEISEDRLHGSREITQRAMLYICEHIMDMDDSISAETAKQRIADLCETMMQAQSTMVQIFNTANELLLNIEGLETTQDIICRSLDFLERERFREAEKLDSLSKFLKSLYKEDMSLLLHSHSSTVNSLLSTAADKGYIFSVVVSEGRPMMEGRLTAAELSSHDIPVTIVCDAASSSVMRDVDVVILGTDGVTEHGVVNKIGSMALALTAKYHSKPFYILSTSKKFLPSAAGRVPIEEHNPIEVWSEIPQGVCVLNRYYEFIPFDLISLITEDGMMDSENIMKRLAEMPVSRLMPRL